MIYMIFSQIVILLLNLALLIISKLTNEFHQLIYILPIIAYSVLMVMFYISYVRTMRQLPYSNAYYAVAIPGIVINIAFAIVETFIEDPANPVMLYICTSVVQLINLVVLFSYMQKFAMQIMAMSQQLIHKILSYLFFIIAILALYFCFVNIFIVVLCLMVSSFFAAISTAMFLIAARVQNR